VFLRSAGNEAAFSDYGSLLICGSSLFREVLYEGFDVLVCVVERVGKVILCCLGVCGRRGLGDGCGCWSCRFLR
jgi:hypothetical protein